MIAVENNNFTNILEEVIAALKEKGYEPWDQIKGYLELDSDSYITRHGNAREKIKLLDKELLKIELKRRNLL